MSESQEVAVGKDNLHLDEAEIQRLAAELKDKKAGIEVTSSYWDPAMGEVNNVYYVGDTTMPHMNKPGERVPAVKLLNEDGEILISAAAVIVSTLADFKPGQAFQITKTGTEKGKNGEYSKFKICELV